jgi:hypothetical protein
MPCIHSGCGITSLPLLPLLPVQITASITFLPLLEDPCEYPAAGQGIM